MSIAALARRHRIPGDLLDRPAKGFTVAVKETVRIDGHFAELAVFEECYLASIVEQCGNVGSNKGFAFTPTDDDGRGILCDNEALRISAIEEQQGVGTADLAQRTAHRVEKIQAFFNFFAD